jgi:hypothetical protein
MGVKEKQAEKSFGIIDIIGIVGYLSISTLGLAIHIWTIVKAYSLTGILGAVITLFLPVIGEIYWFIRLWKISETVFNFYCTVLIGYLVFIHVMILVMVIVGAVAKKRD